MSIVIGLVRTKLVRMWNSLGDACVDNRVARHGSWSTIHVQSPSRATHTAGGIERHTSASVSKLAQAQSEPSGGQFSIQYQQVLR